MDKDRPKVILCLLIASLVACSSPPQQSVSRTTTNLPANAKQQSDDASRRQMQGDIAGAAQIWETLAKAGYADAQYGLGALYWNGAIPQPESNTAIELITKAADQNHKTALSVLGWMYLHGIGVPSDRTKAYELLIKAANLNSALAQYALGVDASYVTKDYAAANYWLSRAAKQDVSAYDLFGVCGGTGSSNPGKLQGYCKHAESFSGNARFQFGLLHYYGDGVPVDHTQALMWVRDAINRQSSEAEEWLGQLYQNGTAVRKSLPVAYVLYSLSAQASPNPESKAAGRRSQVASLMTPKQLKLGDNLLNLVKNGQPALEVIDTYLAAISEN